MPQLHRPALYLSTSRVVASLCTQAMAIRKKLPTQLLITVSSEIIFFYLLSYWNQGQFTPVIPTVISPSMSKYLADDGSIPWRKWRQTGEWALSYEPHQLSEELLCEALLRHCKPIYDLQTCPSGSSDLRMQLLEQCFSSFLEMKKFTYDTLADMQETILESSKTGLAVILYGCTRNPFLRTLWKQYSEVGVAFMILCPPSGEEARYPAAELVSHGGGSLDIHISQDFRKDEQRSLLDVAERLEVALQMLSKDSPANGTLFFALLTVPVLTYLAIFGSLSQIVRNWKWWIPISGIAAPYSHGLIGRILWNNVSNEIRRRLIWLIPLHAMLNLTSEPYAYYVHYFVTLISARVAITLLKIASESRLSRVQPWHPQRPSMFGRAGIDHIAAWEAARRQEQFINEIAVWLQIRSQAVLNAQQQRVRSGSSHCLVFCWSSLL